MGIWESYVILAGIVLTAEHITRIKEIILSMECKQCDVRYKPCAKANNVLCCFECEYYWVCGDKCDGPKETDEE